MKHKILTIVTAVLCFIILFSVTAGAKTYSISDTDMKVDIDDSIWYVFTRDNIKDNPEFDELGTTYDFIHDLLYNNKAYLYGILYIDEEQFIEIIVRTEYTDSGVANLTNYTEKDINDFAEALAEKKNIENYGSYQNDYNYAKLEYIDPTLDYHICEYITVVNKHTYAITFQSTQPFDEVGYEQIDNIIDSIEFSVDTELEENFLKKDKIDDSRIWISALRGALIGGGVGGGIGVFRKLAKNKKKKKNTPEETADTDNNDQSCNN